MDLSVNLLRLTRPRVQFKVAHNTSAVITSGAFLRNVLTGHLSMLEVGG